MKNLPRSIAVVFAFIALLFGCRLEQLAPAPDGPPATDIWLFEMSDSGADLITRITDREGYDNQPVFLFDGSGILFSSDRTGRTDTHLYDVESGSISRITFTDADKYSPTPIPGTGDSLFSVVHSDSSTFQGLWQYSIDRSFEPSPVTEVDAVAYFTWAGEGSVLFWRLGEPNTLQIIDVASSDTTVIDQGRVESLQRIPGEAASSYIIQKGDEPARIMRFDWATRESSLFAPAVEGARYFAWTPDGELLMLSGSQLWSLESDAGAEWTQKANLEIQNGSRLAVSPDGRLLAVVGTR